MKPLDNGQSRKGILKSDVLVGNSREWACSEPQTIEENRYQMAVLHGEVAITVKFIE